MKTIGNLLVVFISVIIIVVVGGVAGMICAYILEFLEDKIDDFIYNLKEKENETDR